MLNLKNDESENIRQILILRNIDNSFGLNLLFLGKILETSAQQVIRFLREAWMSFTRLFSKTSLRY